MPYPFVVKFIPMADPATSSAVQDALQHVLRAQSSIPPPQQQQDRQQQEQQGLEQQQNRQPRQPPGSQSHTWPRIEEVQLACGSTLLYELGLESLPQWLDVFRVCQVGGGGGGGGWG